MSAFAPLLESIDQAGKRLRGHVVRTPLVPLPDLVRDASGTVYAKLEPLQKTGSFKIRGALNRVLCLSDQERQRGVVAWSSGNHAQGVAAACSMFNVPAVIVMPADAPTLKINNTRALGAEVVLYDRATQDREAIARDIASARGLVVVPSYDDPYIIAGQGTLGLEIMEQATELNLRVDDIIVPTSGGGLLAGVGLAARRANPNVGMYSAEPEHYDDHRQSFLCKSRKRNSSTANALCDALLAATPGELTWSINVAHMHGGYAPTDAEVCAAMAYAFQRLKIVVEPGGAVALASILNGTHKAPGRTTVVVLSGGNVDQDTYMQCLARGRTA